MSDHSLKRYQDCVAFFVSHYGLEMLHKMRECIISRVFFTILKGNKLDHVVDALMLNEYFIVVTG